MLTQAAETSECVKDVDFLFLSLFSTADTAEVNSTRGEETAARKATRWRHLACAEETTTPQPPSVEFMRESASVANQARASAEARRIKETSPRN